MPNINPCKTINATDTIALLSLQYHHKGPCNISSQFDQQFSRKSDTDKQTHKQKYNIDKYNFTRSSDLRQFKVKFLINQCSSSLNRVLTP